MSGSVWAPLAWCDGAVMPLEQATVPAHDRTVMSGLGAFETLRVAGGAPFLGDRHVARLRRSLAAVGLEAMAALDRLPAGIAELARAADRPDAVARVTVTAGPEGGTGRVLVHLRALPAAPTRPVEVGVAPFAHDPRSPLAGVKSTSYGVHVLLRDRAHGDGRYEDLLVDPDGRVTEGTVSNVFGVRGGELLTPPLGVGILAGVTRGLVAELAAAIDVPLREVELRREELAGLDELFLTGAVKGLVDVDRLDGIELPHERPVFRRLRRAYDERLAGAAEEA